jgi:PAS domain S-box-containing protein/putative nucleotidyltransferase with HDIG domain
LARGYASAIALPLRSDGEPIGVLTIDAMEPNAFDAREVELLTELAGDLAFGIRTLRNEAERRRAEAALQDSEARYHDLYDTAPTGYASVRADGALLQCNAAFAGLLGYTRDELCERPVLSLYAEGPDGRDAAAEVFRRFVSGQGVKDVELQMQRRDGTPLWVSLSVEPVRDADGHIVESRSSIIDISARKAADAERQRFAERIERSLLQAIQAISLTIEMRDPYTAGHQQRVAELASAIAAELGLDPVRIEGLRLGALIHDIGKVYVPAEILNRPGKLEEAQFVLIKSHPQVGYDIVKGIEFPWPLADMVVQHHERLDGSGYPRGLGEGAILLEARILAVADVVEAMASHRPYRAALPVEEALAEVEQHSGSLYDAEVVAVCVRLFRDKGFAWSSAGPAPR